ncbi:MAG TPA: dihydrolipoamide acetyltransferase family protein [Bacteroidia bacterium]|jgi:pyruvate dehydrogenase E2 component (dihydrolipoamide acetyltransferase)|nr:dihydrolipoamide acetyltransferase family protein [Bacteroidia bacterium]
MAEIIRMPKLSDTMTEGVVAAWHKKIGDTVKSGELLADIETDKATMEFESFQEGTLLYIGVEKGKTAPVDSILAIVGKQGEDIKALIEGDKKAPAAEPKKEEAKAQPKEEAKAPEQVKVAASNNVPAQKPAEPATPVITHTGPTTPIDKRAKVSPLAKKLAKERHINIGFIKGSGDGGRIIKSDIENFNGGSAQFTGVESFTEEPVSQMRKTIARRLAESKFSAPHFYLTMEIEMDEMMKAREAINMVGQTKISYNDIVVKAVAQALRNNPKVNSSWRGDTIRYNKHIHIGIAVAVEEGLLVPVIKFADSKTLSQISIETKAAAQKAKEKKLQPADWEGNTFTISNLGMFGIEEFTAIINPPDACIMAVGGIKETALVKDGQLVAGHVMKVTMSCDHRVVDGATGAAFLQTFKQYMEYPVVLFGMQSF